MTRNKIINIQNLFLLLLISFFLFLIRPAILGQLNGAFRTTTIPNEYVKLADYLNSQGNFSRTLWVPTTQRFAFYNSNHPTVSAETLFNIYDYPKLIKKIGLSEKLLQEASIKYVVVPYDSQGEIFLSDRKYSNDLYQKTINNVMKISYLKQISGFGMIKVFEVPGVKEHFYFNNQKTIINNQQVKYQYVSPVEYSVSVVNARKGDELVFSENYDKNWTVINSKFKIQNSKFDNRFNSFKLPEDGNYTLKVYYSLQKYVDIGVLISISAFIISLLALLYRKK